MQNLPICINLIFGTGYFFITACLFSVVLLYWFIQYVFDSFRKSYLLKAWVETLVDLSCINSIFGTNLRVIALFLAVFPGHTLIYSIYFLRRLCTYLLPYINVENILKGSLDLIPSPLPSVKIQIFGGKVCLRCKGKTLLGVVNKLLKTKSLLTSPTNVLPYYSK